MSQRLLVYLDVDGVILGHAPGTHTPALADGAVEFVRWCLDQAEPWWLTTHGQRGDNEQVLRYLSQFADEAALDVFRQVPAVAWTTLKTDAIDLKSGREWFWLEDQIWQSEQAILLAHGADHRLLTVNTRSNYFAIHDVWEFLRDELVELAPTRTGGA